MHDLWIIVNCVDLIKANCDISSVKTKKFLITLLLLSFIFSGAEKRWRRNYRKEFLLCSPLVTRTGYSCTRQFCDCQRVFPLYPNSNITGANTRKSVLTESNFCRDVVFTIPEHVLLHSCLVLKPFHPLGWQPPAIISSHFREVVL